MIFNGRTIEIGMLAAFFACLFLIGCHNAEQESAAKLLGDFHAVVKIVDDPLYKNAALNEEAEPDKAKDYFNAHESLRDMMVDPERKAVVTAAFLSKQPTSLRPLAYKADKEVMLVTCALGPTDDKKGVFALRKKGVKWVIDDFENAFAKRSSENKEPKIGLSGTEIGEGIKPEPKSGAQ